MPALRRRASYCLILSASALSCETLTTSAVLRLRFGGDGAAREMHCKRDLVQAWQGCCLSHFTLRCTQVRHASGLEAFGEATKSWADTAQLCSGDTLIMVALSRTGVYRRRRKPPSPRYEHPGGEFDAGTVAWDGVMRGVEPSNHKSRTRYVTERQLTGNVRAAQASGRLHNPVLGIRKPNGHPELAPTPRTDMATGYAIGSRR